MKRTALALTAVLLAAGAASAQDIKVNACLNIWYTQMMDSNLRLDTAQTSRIDGAKDQPTYFQLNSAFKENGFTLRRSEVYLTGNVTDDLSWNLMFDPNVATTAANPTILQDAAISYKLGNGWSLKVGQFKPLQTYEASMVGSPDLLFYDRSQMARQFGDKRDRGVVATYAWGDANGLAGKVNVGVINGTFDKDSGKANDANAQKDFITRFEFSYGKEHKFGLYSRNGATDAADKGSLNANLFTYASADAPTKAEILDNKDKTTNLGVYYNFENNQWIGSFEAITGLLGRRFASVGIPDTAASLKADGTVVPASANAALRQHLDQKYLGYVLTGGYKMGQHTFLVRYDFLNYNSGNDWYGPYNPYTQNTSTGASLGADYTPKFTETVLGWNYAIPAAKWKSSFKLDYILRSKNFLKPRAGQTGEQGGDSIVAVLQVGF